MKKPENIFYWGSAAGLLLSVSVWAYSTFEQKDSAKEWRDSIIQRLDRIENKIDHINN